MTKAERVVTALRGGKPDMVPFMFNTVMQNVQEAVVGHPIDIPTYNGMNNAGWLGAPEDGPQVIPCLCEVPEFAEKMNLDAINIQVLPPMFVKWVVKDGDACVAGGLIDSEEMQKKCEAAMPDPDDEKLLRSIEEMIRRYKGEFALGARVRMGASPTLLSLGMENLASMLADEDEALPDTIRMYTDWSARLCRNLSELDFDYFWCFDDIAFTQNMMVSPACFREYFKEPLRHVRDSISKPTIFHSDGNYGLVLEDLIDNGIDAIHPIERASYDGQWLVDKVGGRLAFVGNVDINHILADATEEEVFEDVRSRIELFGRDGGYVICDSNSIPAWCTAKNLLAMSRAVEQYRHIY